MLLCSAFVYYFKALGGYFSDKEFAADYDDNDNDGDEILLLVVLGFCLGDPALECLPSCWVRLRNVPDKVRCTEMSN